MPELITEYPQFFTATCLEWKHLLKPDKYKDIIVDSLRFLVEDQRVIIYGFVIMINHIHIVWQVQAEHKRENVQRDFLKFTAQRIKDDLLKHHPEVLQHLKVDAKDRVYQIWERNPLTVDLWSEKTMLEKLTYMHQNPVRAGVCQFPEQYKYSSAMLYSKEIDEWGFLTHVRD